MVWNYDCRITRVCSAHRRRRCSGTHDEGDPSVHKNLVCCRSLLGSGSIPKIFLDSHTKRPELRESYQLQESDSALILCSAAGGSKAACRCCLTLPAPLFLLGPKAAWAAVWGKTNRKGVLQRRQFALYAPFSCGDFLKPGVSIGEKLLERSAVIVLGLPVPTLPVPFAAAPTELHPGTLGTGCGPLVSLSPKTLG